MKKTLIIFTTLSTLTLTTIASAQTPAPTGLGSLEAFLTKYYIKTKKWVTDQNYQSIPDLKKIQATNTATATFTKTISKTEPSGLFGSHTQTTNVSQSLPISQYISETAKNDTSNNLQNTLTQIPYEMYNLPSSAATTVKNSIDTADGTSFEKYLSANKLAAMTIGKEAEASDSLYVGDQESKGDFYEQNKSLLKKPSPANNKNFNFSNLIVPNSYSKTQEYGAQQFIKYAALSTQPIATGIHFNKLFERPKAIVALKNSPEYQTFTFRLRGLLAIRSMNINTLNQLIAERTPVTGLGEAAGLKKSTPASPMQVEAYQANHRIESKKWYNSVENASPATVQRETLIVLAEMEHQNYILHHDNERLLSAITALGLQSGMQNMGSFLMQQSPKMNEAIDTALNSAYPTQKAKSDNNTAPEAQASETSTPTNTTNTTNSTNSTNTSESSGF
ncbi:MAG: hypothetical protein COY58_00715 [Gammaproteobacteria bacterium CG_4_10_14_0_8_um_filter_38_16]|nr:MAG: hypothetical protein COY58_00715 [Gammaproteobacteria bacterium CG_4_10_14_0_8_um_filter_38_16]PJA04321.1 MAG: hypothetical protein COX72_00645 [Gammaproteobacteria bacterium CG_4_10_14_0_2_um_filter_38_22]PJB10075.1 MAG: hypothetical protein CO120_06655 [Gammaproteobacteria bacterium CG_4_9_14_3_um_filter_38_9]